MSALLATLSEKILSNPSEATQLGIEHFNQSTKPFDDLLEYLTQLSDTDSSIKNINLIAYLLQSFSQWKNQFYKSSSLPQFDNTVVNNLLLKTLPLTFLKDFLQIFEISKEYLLSLIRTSLKSPSHSSTYKRALNMIVTLDYQLEFQPHEILLPLILTSKDHYIDLYLNKSRQYEVYLLKLLNHLHEKNGKQLSEILANEYQMKDVPFSKKNVSKLAVRYWNLLGNDEDENYPNLKILQQKRTLSFLLNTRYNGLNGEKTMSDECWNELVGVNINEMKE